MGFGAEFAMWRRFIIRSFVLAVFTSFILDSVFEFALENELDDRLSQSGLPISSWSLKRVYARNVHPHHPDSYQTRVYGLPDHVNGLDFCESEGASGLQIVTFSSREPGESLGCRKNGLILTKDWIFYAY